MRQNSDSACPDDRNKILFSSSALILQSMTQCMSLCFLSFMSLKPGVQPMVHTLTYMLAPSLPLLLLH